MYSNLLLLVILVLPIPIIIKGIKGQKAPYGVCLDGAVAAGVGILMIFILSAVNGQSVGEEFQKSMTLATEMLEKSGMPEYPEGMITFMVNAMLGSMLIFAVVVSYLEYLILSHLIKVKGEPALRLPPFREFSLPRNSVVGWFFIFILSWVLRLTGFGAADIVSINVNLIFEFTFALQGISLVLFGCHMRKIPKAIPVILIIVLWVLTIGKTVLFVLGIADLLLNLRSKMLPR